MSEFKFFLLKKYKKKKQKKIGRKSWEKISNNQNYNNEKILKERRI